MKSLCTGSTRVHTAIHQYVESVLTDDGKPKPEGSFDERNMLPKT